MGLHPVLRRVWFNRWHGSPIAPVHSRYEWSWLNGFVHPHSRETYGWLLPWVNIDLFNRVLADVTQHVELGSNRRMVLVLDQTGWHTSKRVEVPEEMYLVFLPAYSPHMQPAERLWPIINEGIANQVFDPRCLARASGTAVCRASKTA